MGMRFSAAGKVEARRIKRTLLAVLMLCALLAPAASGAQQTASTPSPNPQAAQQKAPAAQETPAAPGNPEIQVWVNTNSGVYHCPGTHWYGATKSGNYMKQSEAQQKGFRPAYHRVCK